ncbi:MAG: 2-amino-4-hydroxy-6-hydroxymethyldihydropteridine diphosphokinase [Candidatus Acidiferrales bacterium]
MAGIYLSLGSSIGDRAQNIARAIEALAIRDIRVLKRSSLYETEPVGMREPEWFLNGVVEVQTELQPHELIRALLEIERSMGRSRAASPARKLPRTIDMDILFYGSQIIREAGLEIPHSRMSERRFVLVPFAEIAPAAMHPVLKKTVAELLAGTPDRSEVRPWQS